MYCVLYYLVSKLVRSTLNLRPLFNASRVTTTGVGLNDKLYTGPKLQDDSGHVLLRRRKHEFVTFSGRTIFNIFCTDPGMLVQDRVLRTVILVKLFLLFF